VRWAKLRGADDQSVIDSAEETSAESVPTVSAADGESVGAERRSRWTRAIAYGLLPGLALLLAAAAGYLKWQDASAQGSPVAGADAVRAATDGTIALLSYKPETVEKDLEAARSRLTGTFLNAYTSLTHDVVIPGAKQKQVSAVATVPAAASVQATAEHAVVLLCVNQAVVVGQDAPTTTASSVRVSLDKIGGRWLISQFDPV
jgi:Mce-associated membrane protein